MLQIENMVNQERVLIVGALGQVGRELIYQLSNKHGVENVIVSDLKHSDNIDNNLLQPSSAHRVIREVCR